MARVIGVGELNAAFQRVASSLSNPELRKAYLVAGRKIRDVAKLNAPRGRFSREPGSLRKALQTFASRGLKHRERIAAITWVRVTKGSKKAPHAHLVEEGTTGPRSPKHGAFLVFRNQQGQWIRKRRVAAMPASRFFRRAVESRGPSALQEALEATSQQVDKAYRG